MSGVVAASVILVALSPLALHLVTSFGTPNWAELSNVGQTYGAVSALLSALALLGVAGSVFLQARETRYNRWAAGRAHHYELIRLALDDPLYRQVFDAGRMPEEAGRLTGYTNLLLEFWTMLWEFGDVSESRLRLHLAEILGTEAGRSYWEYVGKLRPAGAGSRREREFHRIADEIYRQSASPSPRKWTPRGGSPAARRRLAAPRVGNCVMLAAAGGAVISVLRQRRSCGRSGRSRAPRRPR
jgi:hypothetical protein